MFSCSFKVFFPPLNSSNGILSDNIHFQRCQSLGGQFPSIFAALWDVAAIEVTFPPRAENNTMAVDWKHTKPICRLTNSWHHSSVTTMMSSWLQTWTLTQSAHITGTLHACTNACRKLKDPDECGWETFRQRAPGKRVGPDVYDTAWRMSQGEKNKSRKRCRGNTSGSRG